MPKRQKTYPWQTGYPKNILWESYITPKPVFALLSDIVARFPHHQAIDFLGSTYSYQSLFDAVNAMAAGLQKQGVVKGTKVALVLPNCPQFIIAYYAICKIGGVIVNCNPLYTVPELEHQLKDAEAHIILTVDLTFIYQKIKTLMSSPDIRIDHVIVTRFSSALPWGQSLLFRLFKYKQQARVVYNAQILSFETLLQTQTSSLPVEIDPLHDVAVLQYTGGTTGTPKGAMLTHANVYVNAVQTGMWFSGLKEGEEVLVGVLPFFHVFAMTVIMNLAVHKACKILLYPRLDLDRLIRDIPKKKPTIIPGVPSLFSAMTHFDGIERYDLSSIKMCISGGAPLPGDVKRGFEFITHCSLVEGYGLSETSPVVSANPLFGIQKPGSIGLPLPDTIIEIRGLDNEHTLLPLGEIGEICIKGPQVMQGYYKHPKETERVLVDGCLHTGDMGYMDEDGYVFVADRLKDMIIVNGFNVYPREVEEAIYNCEPVKEAAVVGVPSEQYGQVVKAYVVLKPGQSMTQEALLAFLQKSLTKYKLPTMIEFRDVLPKTMIGKISKKDL